MFIFGYHSLISLPTMRPDHLTVFLDVADRYKCTIGLREPNPLADRWIGKEGYAPKSVNIKSKTADSPHHPLAGLVVDPGMCPEAFKEETLPRARSNWSVPTGGIVTTEGKEKGLLRVYGKAIHADYDLMVILPIEDEFGSHELTRDVNLKKPKSQAYRRDVHL